MTPGQIEGSIREICDKLEIRRQAMMRPPPNGQGSDRTERPFTLTFDAREMTYEEMSTILNSVRAVFPQWRIKGEWKRE